MIGAILKTRFKRASRTQTACAGLPREKSSHTAARQKVAWLRSNQFDGFSSASNSPSPSRGKAKPMLFWPTNALFMRKMRQFSP